MQVYPLASGSDAKGLHLNAIEVIHVIFRLEQMCDIPKRENCQEGWKRGLSGMSNMSARLHRLWNGCHQVGFVLTLNQNNIDLVHPDEAGGMGAFACWS